MAEVLSTASGSTDVGEKRTVENVGILVLKPSKKSIKTFHICCHHCIKCSRLPHCIFFTHDGLIQRRYITLLKNLKLRPN